MGVYFWLRRFLLMFCIAFTVIISAHLLRGHALMFSLSESFLWAIISANIFTASRINQSRKGQYCALCKDTPEMQNG
ncbi:MAG: hypothetical protein ACREPB_08045 [Arenimonas sp.]